VQFGLGPSIEFYILLVRSQNMHQGIMILLNSHSAVEPPFFEGSFDNRLSDRFDGLLLFAALENSALSATRELDAP
jgi:hypothetical protein